jgi:hypothetical protein
VFFLNLEESKISFTEDKNISSVENIKNIYKNGKKNERLHTIE